MEDEKSKRVAGNYRKEQVSQVYEQKEVGISGGAGVSAKGACTSGGAKVGVNRSW